MKLKLIFFTILSLLLSNVSHSQLLQWNTFGNAGTETTEPSVGNNANIAPASLTLGAGVTPAGNGNRFGGSNWFDTGDTNPSTLIESVAGNDYIQFIVNPTGGYTFTATSLVFSWDRSSTGPQHVALRSSVDGFNTDLGSLTLLPASISSGNTITISGLTNISTATTFRLYGYGATATGGTGGFDSSLNVVNVQLNGTVASPISYIVSAQNGDWFTGSTWVGGVVPTSAQNARIDHTVTVGVNVVRDAGTFTLVSSGATLAVSAAVLTDFYNNNGTTTIDGTFELRNGGYALGNNFIYGSNGTLNFNTDFNYVINAADAYWPTANGPFNVNVLNGGIVLGGSRTVNGWFSTANVSVNGGIDFPGQTLRLNGTTQILPGGYFKMAPIYGAASSLIYDTGGNFSRGNEWQANGVGTIGVTPGYPNDIWVKSSILDFNNGGTTTKAIEGSLSIFTGMGFNMNIGTSQPFPLIVKQHISNAGTFTLGNVALADLKIGGNFTNTGTFNGNGRAVFFTAASGTQIISSLPSLTIPYMVFDSSGNRTVQLDSFTSLTISAPGAGTAISFGSAADILDINGRTLTIGTAGVANTVAGLGTFKGSATSNLTLLGTGSIGTLRFTAAFENLGTLTVNRTSGVTGFTLGTPLTVNASMVLTNGRANVGNFPLTIGVTGTITSSATNYVIADLANGVNASLRKVFSAAGNFIYPIGDISGDYTPVTLATVGGSYPSAYAGAAVNDIKHPSYDATTDYITRYWDITSLNINAPTSFTATATYVDADVNTPGIEPNYQSNKWNGTVWSNGGSTVNAASNSFSVPLVSGATNQITAGLRNADINVIATPLAATYLNGSTYDFGNLATGNTYAVTFTIQNIGQASLNVTATTITGSTAYVYTTPYTSGNILGPLGTKTFTVTFTPSAIGTFTGSISIPNTDPVGAENPYVINFTGVGSTPASDINITGSGVTLTTINTPNSLNDTQFAAIPVLTTSPPKVYTIQNLGNINLTLTPPSPYVILGGANPGDFLVSMAPAALVAPAGSTTFNVTFTPTVGGLRTATVTIWSNDPDEPSYTFNISGTGQDREIEVTGAGNAIVDGTLTVSTTNNTQFGNVNITTGSVSKVFTIYNPGALALTISGTTITGVDAADFTITTFPTGTLNSNVSTILAILFNPSTVGVKNATVTITNNDTTESPYTFAIQGTGVDYIPCALGAFQTIAVQDFEVVPATPTMGYSYLQDPGAGLVSVIGGQARGSSRTVNSNKFIGARSFQMAGHLVNSGTELSTTILFATVDASAYQEVSLNFKVGAYSTTNTQGPDTSPEKISLYISTNNGATYSQEMDITGSNNSIWDINTSLGSSTWNYDGNNIAIVASAGNASVNTGPRDITINNLPSASQLKIKIVMTVDRLDELWVIDDVKLQGKTLAVSTWDGTTWSPSPPTNSVKAIINGDFNTNPHGDIEACECQINSTFILNVAPGDYLEVQSNLTNDGTLTVADDGSLVQVNNNAVNTGTASVTRDTAQYEKYDYTYWSSPVASSNIGTTFPGWRTDYSFTFNTVNFADLNNDTFDDAAPYAWTFAGPGANTIPGVGYAIMGNTSAGSYPLTSTVTFTGALNNGVITPAIALSGDFVDTADDFNLIGNPYASAISATAFINSNPNLSGTLYFWTHVDDISASNPGPNAQDFISDDYALFNLTGGTRASFTGSAVPNGFIASGQGFLVEAISAGTVTFNNSMRNKSYNNTQFFRNTEGSQTDDEKDRVWLNLRNDDDMFCQQLVGYFDTATSGYDWGYDGLVNPNNNFVSFYSFIDGEKYRIQGRSAFDINDRVSLGYSSGVVGTFTISIDNAEGQLAAIEHIYLEDKMLNIYHDLKQASYTFTTDAGTFDGRFILRYTNETLSAEEFESTNGNVVISTGNNTIGVRSSTETIQQISIYDLVGRQLYRNKAINAPEFKIYNFQNKEQGLIIKIILDNGQIVSRKIIF